MIILYFKLTPEALNELKNISKASPAIRLFQSWCKHSLDDMKWRGRFKLICKCLNLDDFGIPAAISQYNGKPILIRKTGTVTRNSEYIQMRIDIFKFDIFAKKSINLLISRMKDMLLEVGFVIEVEQRRD